ncbi:MAG: hypothetical protein WB508_07325 [Aeromicrobium sp.]|uniref:hypothetical protein n=1 Tax=Aeromicrobium sp. TaxID=1871063 RepID=UPI003C69C659
MNRLIPVPDRCQSAHGVFTAEPVDGAADFPAPGGALLRRFGASADDVARLEARAHARVFLTETSTVDAASAARRAREDALAFAAEHDGVVVDLAVPRIVTGPISSAASAWVAVDVDPAGLTSRGLETFGLPELRLDGIDPEAVAPSIALILGVAQRLLTEWPARDPVGPAAVTLHDIALAYDDQVDQTGPERSTDLLIAFHAGELVLTLVGDPAADLFGS